MRSVEPLDLIDPPNAPLEPEQIGTILEHLRRLRESERSLTPGQIEYFALLRAPLPVRCAWLAMAIILCSGADRDAVSAATAIDFCDCMNAAAHCAPPRPEMMLRFTRKMLRPDDPDGLASSRSMAARRSPVMWR